ncbi:hypothetical protein C8R46DRAFT_984989 [Mycena filopes]|nr:hypothetical protein C8R46DRAFT_984989 [Mycena filopes]
MHYCLKIPEIVDSVCDYLDPEIGAQWSPVGGLRDLAMLSRTCRLFEGPAQDHLWRKTALGTFLLACMPSDLWFLQPPIASWTPPEMRLLRPICDSDWDRIRFHAPRVRHLSSASTKASVLGILPALNVSLPQPLFTNLRNLMWDFVDPHGFPYIRLFITPTLESLSFELNSHSAASLLPTLATQCPKLTKLSVTSAPEYESPGISDLVVALRTLSKIVVPSLNWVALEHLSRRQPLKSLHLDSLPTGPMAPALPAMARFPALHTLHLGCPGILPTTAFLNLCLAIPLAAFSVFFYDLVTAAEMHDLFVALSAGVVHDSLEELFIRNDCIDYVDVAPESATHLIPHRDLRLLQSFTNLTSLSIASSIGFMLDDAALDELLAAWPHLTSFSLRACFPTHQPSTTLAGLRSFARHCPRLTDLLIALDARIVPALDLRDSSHALVRQQQLVQLHVVHSPVTAPALAVARFISALFPNLKTVPTVREYVDNDEDDEDDATVRDAIRSHLRWKEVEAFLPEIAAIREEGLAFGAQ